MNRNHYMMKGFFFSLCLLFFLSLAERGKAFSETFRLSETSFTLHMNEGKQLKVRGKKVGKLQFVSKNKKICTVSSKGKILAISPGETEIQVHIFGKNGRKLAKRKAFVKVDTTFLAFSNKDLTKAHLGNKTETVLLKPKKDKKFTLPAKKLGYSLQIDGRESKEELFIYLPNKAELREVSFLDGKKIHFKIEGKLPHLNLRSKNAKVKLTLNGKNAILSNLFVEETSILSLNFNSKAKNEAGTKIYVSKKSNLTLNGKNKSPVSVFVWKEGEESETTANMPIQYFSHVPSILVINKGAETGSITTLDYKVSVTVDNKTDRELKINTPSVIKTLPGKTRKTVHGK